KIRGRMVVLLEAFWAAGWIAAAVIGTFVVGASDTGWRWALAIGMVPALYALYVRMALPESVRYLEATNRHAEAEEIVQSFDTSALDNGAVLSQQTPPADVDADPTATSIWSPPLRARTAALWIIWFCINLSYYGAFIWIPSLLVADGLTLVRSFSFKLIITLAQLPGYAAAAWLMEVWGRRITLAVCLIGAALSAGAFGLADSAISTILTVCLLSLFNLRPSRSLYATAPAPYPTPPRARRPG